jgi:hypothetical protein
LAGTLREDGYISVKLTVDGKKFILLLHVLLAMMFKKNPKKNIYTIVDHKDRNRGNNKLDNLRWA